uniref:Uncharacterized protein n=1 Tax=Hyaloperonospora arabidopsidis (strain Emoy2) TaxID=559515 RepID=M4C5J4_HYAAE
MQQNFPLPTKAYTLLMRVRGLEDAELKQYSGGIGCKESASRKRQLNPMGITAKGSYPNVLAHFVDPSRRLLCLCV